MQLCCYAMLMLNARNRLQPLCDQAETLLCGPSATLYLQNQHRSLLKLVHNQSGYL